MVTLRLANISLWGHHGLDESEIRNGGPFLLSIELTYRESAGAHDNDVAARPDYAKITDSAVKLFQGRRFNMIEPLAGFLADKILSEFSGIASATVIVRKLSPVMPHILDYVEASVTRSRE